MPNTFEPRVGHRFTFRTDPVPATGFDGVVHCRVLALEPPRLLRISWAGGTLDTTVTWELAPERRGTRLLLTHEGSDDTDPVQQMTRRILGGGRRGQVPRRLAAALAALDRPGGTMTG